MDCSIPTYRPYILLHLAVGAQVLKHEQLLFSLTVPRGEVQQRNGAAWLCQGAHFFQGGGCHGRGPRH